MAIVLDIDHEAGDLSEYDSTVADSGDLSAAAAAALAGTSYGLSCLIDDTTYIYGQATFTQLSGTGWRWRVYLDPNSLTMADGNAFLPVVLRGDSQDRNYLTLSRSGSNYQVAASVLYDGGSTASTSAYTITDAPHYVEVDVTRASGAAASDGTMELLVDGVSQEEVTGIDLYDLSQPDTARIGPRGLDAGTSGTLYLDQFILRDDHTAIGPVSAGAGAAPLVAYHRRRRAA